jgi:transcriptional regulator with XRE-family HTH domain
MLAKTFGSRLRKIREERFLSQRQLAEGVGIETVQISRYERGIALPGADTLLDLATFLRIGAGELLAGEEASNSTEPPIHDISLLERFRDLEKLDRKDRQMIIDLIDAVIASRQIEQVTARRRRSA